MQKTFKSPVRAIYYDLQFWFFGSAVKQFGGLLVVVGWWDHGTTGGTIGGTMGPLVGLIMRTSSAARNSWEKLVWNSRPVSGNPSD